LVSVVSIVVKIIFVLLMGSYVSVFYVNVVLGRMSPSSSQVLKFEKSTHFYDLENLKSDIFEGDKTK
jgi:hypothetical protein